MYKSLGLMQTTVTLMWVFLHQTCNRPVRVSGQTQRSIDLASDLSYAVFRRAATKFSSEGLVWGSGGTAQIP